MVRERTTRAAGYFEAMQAWVLDGVFSTWCMRAWSPVMLLDNVMVVKGEETAA